MRTLKLTIAYDGTRYAGWQVQKAGARGGRWGARERRTIQGTLERILKQILREPVKVVGSGRTDAGVHALAQVAHVRTHTDLSCKRLLRAVNALLPPDIAVTHIEDVPASFHARFNTLRKHYRYRIFTGSVMLPFIRPYVHHVRVPLNVALMRREAAALRHRHDFRAFARVPRDRSGSLGKTSQGHRRGAGSRRNGTVRTLSDIAVIRRGQEIHVDVEGRGFLHTMIRSIAGTLLDVGRGRLPPGTIREMLRTKQRRLAGTTAPAQGLCLVSVDYTEGRG